jgi:hypothetical protein
MNLANLYQTGDHKMKKSMRRFSVCLLALVMVATIAFPLSALAVFATDISISEETELTASYENVCDFINQSGIPASITYETYANGYDSEEYGSVQEYEIAFLQIFYVEPTSYLRSSGGPQYYYNTGTSCPTQADYSKYNLTSILQKGDIVHDAAGGSGLTGHTAIVEGIFTSGNKTYVRLVEAIYSSGNFNGVKRSILDATRVDERQTSVYRVTSATTAQKNAAVSFCVTQCNDGDTYYLDFGWDTSTSETDWYCSELIYAAYYNQGITLATGGGLPGVLPNDIISSSLLTQVY